MFDDLMAANLGMKAGKKTHRGRRGRGFGAKPTEDAADPHAKAQEHITNASASKDPKATTAHLFKALSALKKCP